MAWSEKKKFPLLLAFLQVVFVILFGIFGGYHESTDSRHGHVGGEHDELHPRYPMFQDVHIMVFVGFGFLMTFLKRYGFSAVGYNMLLSSVALQWVIIVQGLIRGGGKGFQMEISWLVEGDFGAAAVLITFGALLGKTSPVQLLVLTVLEIVVYSINFHIGIEMLGAVDAGGSMMIHSFGAYFGLGASLVLRYKWHKDHPSNGSVYHSDMFAMIGTLFLWMCWPSFNGALVPVGNQQHRVIVNTYLSLAASCVATFVFSSLLSPETKFDMVHIQNATLAGGVAVGTSPLINNRSNLGTCADLMVNPYGALLIGAAAGALSVVGYTYVSPWLENIGLHDTCGVNNLHGMPGILGGIAGPKEWKWSQYSGIIAAAIADPHSYGGGLFNVFPLRSGAASVGESPAESHGHIEMVKNQTFIAATQAVAESRNDMGRTAGEQAGMQAAALGITLALALVGGALTGFIIRWSFWVPVIEEEGFQDDAWWETPEEEEGEEEHKGHDVEMQSLPTKGGKQYIPVATQGNEPQPIPVTKYD